MIKAYKDWMWWQIYAVFMAIYFWYEYGFWDERFYVFVLTYIPARLLGWVYSMNLTRKLDFDFKKEYKRRIYIQWTTHFFTYAVITYLMWNA